MLERVIRCFQSQTYPNKELFLLYESDDIVAKNTIAKYHDDKRIMVHCEEVLPKKTLGELRNIAIRNCSGEYFCQWDDDDWFSSNRLEAQYASLGGHESSVLDQWFIFDSVHKTAYLSNKRLWEGSLLCLKEKEPPQGYYPALTRGEDTYLIEQLVLKNKLTLQSSPYLYIYHFYGENTWHSAHWQNIFNSSKRLDRLYSKDIECIINEKYGILEASYRLEQLYYSLI